MSFEMLKDLDNEMATRAGGLWDTNNLESFTWEVNGYYFLQSVTSIYRPACFYKGYVVALS
jgi:hypothetical protein